MCLFDLIVCWTQVMEMPYLIDKHVFLMFPLAMLLRVSHEIAALIRVF